MNLNGEEVEKRKKNLASSLIFCWELKLKTTYKKSNGKVPYLTCL